MTDDFSIDVREVLSMWHLALNL